MKKVFIYCLLALGLMSVASCEKTNPDSSFPAGPVFTGADDAGVLLSNLVFTDENGDISGYVSGFGFNAGDPGEISIHSESLETAQQLFKSWIPEGISALEQGENLVWNLTDTLGVSQGTVKLVPGGNRGAVAHLELPSGFPLVTSVSFIPQSSMPENAELDFEDALEQYFFGNVLNVYPSDFSDGNSTHGSGIFVVIKEYDQDTNTAGILISFPDTEHKIDGVYSWDWDEKVNKYFKRARKKTELEGPIGEAYRTYRKYIDEILSKGGYKQTNGDHMFACLDDDGKGHSIYNLVTKVSKDHMITDWWGWRWAPDFYECLAYFFTLEKGKDGKYKVVYK